MKVLVTCEESQRVCMAFRAKGHEAYSCDIQECSGGHPEWHIMVQGFVSGERAKSRSKTFEGVAQAMADQWG